MRKIITSKENLAQLLMQTGDAPDLRCAGHGTCGRCRVQLLSGTWNVDGKTVSAPCEALSCQTHLTGNSGEVEWTPLLKHGKISSEWNTRELQKIPGTVIAVDIGTTTLAAVKIRDGIIVAKTGCFNAQGKYGDNVVTRINLAATDLSGLQTAVLSSVRELLSELGTDDVSRIAIAGNTVMSCLLHGIDPAPIGIIPFEPPMRIFPERCDLFDGIPLLTVPCIAGYVGGDLTAGLWETQLKPGEMLVDIGTNCEILFHTDNGMVCSAAAAGPAFEGAGLNFGCRASNGAMDHYYGNGCFSVLGEGKIQGLCGSAFIDFLAVERQNGHLNEFGRYEPKQEKKYLSDSIFVHEKDIEQLLKAKAAVWSGIKTLEDHCKHQAEKIYLAGGFAQFLDLNHAIAIGMLPERKYEIVGNTSLAGAARLAIQPDSAEELNRLIDLPQDIPLNRLPDFENNFIDSLLLP